MIIELLGYPSESSQEGGGDIEILCDFKDKETLKALGKNSEQRFNKRFEYIDPLARDLMRQMLEFDPKNRITVE